MTQEIKKQIMEGYLFSITNYKENLFDLIYILPSYLYIYPKIIKTSIHKSKNVDVNQII